jgi:hypothetical protein
MASLKSLQRMRRGGRLKKETRLRGHRLPPLAGPSPPLAPRSTLAILPTQGGEGGRERCPTSVTVNWRPNSPVGAGEAPRGHWAKRLATIRRSPEARARSKWPSELLTRPRKVGLARSLIRPDFSEQRVFADQFQRDGVLLGQRFCCSEWRHQCCQPRRGQLLYWHL